MTIVEHPLLGAQEAPGGDWRTWLLIGDRAAGKTFAASSWLINAARQAPNSSWLIAGPTTNVVRNSLDACWRLLKDSGIVESYTQSQTHLRLRNGAQILARQNLDSGRGMWLDGAVLEEVGLWDPSAWTEVLAMCLRGPDPRVVATVTEYEPLGVRAVLGRLGGPSLRSITLPTLFGRG